MISDHINPNHFVCSIPGTKGNGFSINDVLEYPERIIYSLEKILDDGISWANKYSEFSMEMIYTILGISFILLLIRLKRSGNSGKPLEGWLHYVNVILFLSLALVEILYVMAMGHKTTWFCMPEEVGWGWTIINFIVFAAVVYNQLMCYFDTLRDLQYNSYSTFGWRWGVLSWPIALVAMIVSGFFFEPGILIALVLLLIAQLVQIILIFINVIPVGGLFNSLLITIVYILGSIATVAILIHFLALLIIVIIGYFFLMIFAGGGSGRYCPGCGRALSSNNVCSSCRSRWEF